MIESFKTITIFLISAICLIIPHDLKAQVTIEEWFNLGFDQELYDENRDVIIHERFDEEQQSFPSEWFEHNFLPQKNGELKITLVQAYSQLRPIKPYAKLNITILGEDSRRDTTIELSTILGQPINGPIISWHPSEWFLYGPDPFSFSNSLARSEIGSQAYVRYHHDAEYDSENQRYIYKGTITDENFSGRVGTGVSAYDWGKTRNFKIGIEG